MSRLWGNVPSHIDSGVLSSAMYGLLARSARYGGFATDLATQELLQRFHSMGLLPGPTLKDETLPLLFAYDPPTLSWSMTFVHFFISLWDLFWIT